MTVIQSIVIMFLSTAKEIIEAIKTNYIMKKSSIFNTNQPNLAYLLCVLLFSFPYFPPPFLIIRVDLTFRRFKGLAKV